MKRNAFQFVSALIFIVTCGSSCKVEVPVESPPNVILIMTDDQGIGDFGFMGNPYIKTPHLDRLAEQSLHLTNFYVSPVCAPTRACLMTGRYSERTGVYDTYNGGAIMSTEEITMAEVFRDNGYETGIFGKWHLGDNYPYRPIDQGFETAAVHRAGGMGQPGDVYNFFAGDSSYFDPVLFKNGEPEATKGYCSDVFTEEMIKFIQKNKEDESDRPFFAYLAFNAPHTPLQLPQEYYEMYRDLIFDANAFGTQDDIIEKMSPADMESAKRVYGMVTNIDDNIGKLVQLLNEEDILDNTIVVFLTDNGPQQNRYKLGLRERKGSVFGGGVRVPCLIHYPDRFSEGEELNLTTAHIDLLPSLLDLCGLKQLDHAIDGLNIFADSQEELSKLESRTLFFEWGRGYLMKYRNFAALKEGYKLVGNTERTSEIGAFELHNVESDPMEKNNILEDHREIAISLKQSIDDWYEEIIREENNNISFPSYIGTPHENPVILNRNDAKGTPPAWRGESNTLNFWEVRAPEDGTYNITLKFINPLDDGGNLFFKMHPYQMVEQIRSQSTDTWTFENVKIKNGDYKVVPYVQGRNRSFVFPFSVSFERTDS